MTPKPTTNTATSVRQRLLNRSRIKSENYNALLTQYTIERFLYRLTQSDQAERFILKGAMLFRVWSGALHRPTKDLDLLGQGEPTLASITDTMHRILRTPVANDGLIFDSDSLLANEIRDEQAYGGIRIKLTAHLGNARIPMQIDVGFGDAVTPTAQIHTFPTLLDQDAPRLRMYPPETVIAEKLEAAVARGMTNSRMKDYYDLLVIFRSHDLKDIHLAQAIAATFHRRQTALPNEIPPGLSDRFGLDEVPRRLWREFLRRMRIEDAPEDFSQVIQQVRTRLWPVMVQAQHRRIG